ncbi:helix-turn-helix transcriptional regulator [Pseudooceanicola sp. CBS1P-1]|uniref:HTH luxR-type domain-containing protein n=1 Tax=Pseudooceanicola albus TaxID=2692189 RepID=A0A6L7G863_9RHOB|nr:MULTISPECIES: helix-turn-helix transcriptional regulator [Pseudooceanicola]MBT9385963.1 helix-turn-helix transcriptional regulator [Pseudooceanicola endophyticus]MXN19616.1 hypothetical protein [Pseudooceanicola albus]
MRDGTGSDTGPTLTLACLDCDRQGRILGCDAAAGGLPGLGPGARLTRAGLGDPVRLAALLRAAAAPELRPGMLGSAAAPVMQVNLLPLRPGRVRGVLFLEEPPPGAALSPRECEVLRHAARGLRRDRIAHALNISVPTVDMHCRNLRRKLHARTTSEAVAIRWPLPGAPG